MKIKNHLNTNPSTISHYVNNFNVISNSICFLCKHTIREDDLAKLLLINYVTPNGDYETIKINYNRFGVGRFNNLRNNPHFAMLANGLLLRNDKKEIRRMRRNLSISYNAIKKVCKTNIVGDGHDNIKKDVNKFFYAIKVTFVSLNNNLPNELYDTLVTNINNIPQVEINNKMYKVIDLYKWNTNEERYKIDREVVKSNSIQRKIQYNIAPYVFEYYLKKNQK